ALRPIHWQNLAGFGFIDERKARRPRSARFQSLLHLRTFFQRGATGDGAPGWLTRFFVIHDGGYIADLVAELLWRGYQVSLDRQRVVCGRRLLGPFEEPGCFFVLRYARSLFPAIDPVVTRDR